MYAAMILAPKTPLLVVAVPSTHETYSAKWVKRRGSNIGSTSVSPAGGPRLSGRVAATSPRYWEGPRGTPVSPVCWKYSSGRPAMPMLVSACDRKVLPLRGVVQMRYDDVGAP